MSMKKGNWIPISRDVIYKLSPTAKDGQYSEQTAYLSLREDLEKNEVKGLRDYARIWSWSPKKTFTFFEKIGYKTGQNMETIRKQSGNNQETDNLIIYNDLDYAKETFRKQSGNNQETHTINPNPNPNPKENKKTVPETQSQPTPADTAKRFFLAYANVKLQGENFKKYSERLGNQLKPFVDYWTEPTKSGKRQRWETEKTWELGRRIGFWMSKHNGVIANGKPKPMTEKERNDKRLQELIAKLPVEHESN